MATQVTTGEIEQAMRNALENGRDPIIAAAAVILGKEEAAITKEERNNAKVHTMYILYGTNFFATVKYPRNIGE
jgi:DNA polymerase I-like protein with 3'-5' exonuclease and polymerase domains